MRYLTRARILVLALVAAVSALPSGWGAETFEETSLQLRTALHYDSALAAPLDALVRLYGAQEREEELLALYRAHISRYPDDAGAKAVLARLLKAMERPEAEAFIQSAVQLHPDHAHLQYLLYRSLFERDRDRSLEILSRAIDLETAKSRKSEWLGELLERSGTERGRELARAQLERLLAAEGQTGPTMLSLGQVMFRHQFWDLSVAALDKALALKLNPDQSVEAGVLAARAEAALGRTAEAGNRLDGILARLAPDHHRRQQVMTLRVSVVATEEERETLLARSRQAYEENPEKETAILDYAEILAAGGRSAEALEVLRKGAERVPGSTQIEERVLDMLKRKTDPGDLIGFLESRLDDAPDRLDLRYRLVQARYLGGDPVAAERDLSLLLDGLDESERPDRLLDLGRFLRGAGQRRLALPHYQRFLAEAPARLDVHREAFEILLEEGLEDRALELLAGAAVGEATEENLLDLVGFLTTEGFFGPSRKVLETYGGENNGISFGPGLVLARVRAEVGERGESLDLLDRLREQADTPARYRDWLGAAMRVHDVHRSVESFFDAEQGRFRVEAESSWSPEKMEKFLLLCEAAERRQLAGRVALSIRERLSAGELDPVLRVRLRRLLLRILEDDPDRAAEAETQLAELAREDPKRRGEYQLRRARLYHGARRPDLARGALDGVELAGVESTGLIRESYRMFVDLGLEELAGRALEVITARDLSDLVSWERRLSLLAAEGREDEFRAAIRSLLQGVSRGGEDLTWRGDSRRALRWHLLDSYWRSIARILAGGERIAEALPLLEGVEMEARGEDLLWVNWARAMIFRRMGREDEFRSALQSLREKLEARPEQDLCFPDGLCQSLASAVDHLAGDQSVPIRSGSPAGMPLVDRPVLRWAFEVDTGTRIAEVCPAGNSLLLLDHWGQLYRVDSATGKLIWKRNLTSGSDDSEGGAGRRSEGRLVGDGGLRVIDDLYLHLAGDRLVAHRVEDASPAWRSLPLAQTGPDRAGMRAGRLRFDAAGDVAVLFDTLSGTLAGYHTGTGKLLWETGLARGGTTTSSAEARSAEAGSAGVFLREGRVLAFGPGAGVFEAASGRAIWRFRGDEVRDFPVLLREEREELSADEQVTLAQIGPEPSAIPATALPGTDPFDLDYLGRERDSGERVLRFLENPGRLYAPAVRWSRRLGAGREVHAAISGEALWLMDSEGASRLSLDLPLAAQRFSVRGVFLGHAAGSGWVLAEEGLWHLDGRTGEPALHALDEIGEDFRGIVAGGRVYVAGSRGLTVFNAGTGRRISRGVWDESLIAYRDEGGEDEGQLRGEVTWAGPILRDGPGAPAHRQPPGVAIGAGQIFVLIGTGRIVAVAQAGETP